MNEKLFMNEIVELIEKNVENIVVSVIGKSCYILIKHEKCYTLNLYLFNDFKDLEMYDKKYIKNDEEISFFAQSLYSKTDGINNFTFFDWGLSNVANNRELKEFLNFETKIQNENLCDIFTNDNLVIVCDDVLKNFGVNI